MKWRRERNSLRTPLFCTPFWKRLRRLSWLSPSRRLTCILSTFPRVRVSDDSALAAGLSDIRQHFTQRRRESRETSRLPQGLCVLVGSSEEESKGGFGMGAVVAKAAGDGSESSLVQDVEGKVAEDSED